MKSRGVHSWCNQIPYHPAGQPTDWRIIKSQNFSHRSGSWAPCQAPQPRGQLLEGGASRALGFAGQWGLTAGAPPGPGKQTPPLEGIHRYSEQKPRLHRNLSQTYLLVLEGLLGVGVAVALWHHKRWWPVQWGPMWTLGGARHFESLALRPHPTACKLQCWDASGQTANSVGNGPVHQQTGYLDFLTHSASRHIPWQSLAHQRAKTPLHPPVRRH